MDISELNVVAAASKPNDLELLNPFTGEEIGCSLQVIGYDAKPVVAALKSMDKDLMQRKTKGDISEALELQKATRVRAAIVGWKDFVWEGEKPDYSATLMDEILKREGFNWIADQVDAFARSRENFFPIASKG